MLPSDIPGLAIWLRADGQLFQFGPPFNVPAQPGQVVQQWNDESGNGRHAVATGSNESQWPILRPSSAIPYNALPAVTFASGQFMTIPVNVLGEAPYSILVAFRASSLANQVVIGPTGFGASIGVYGLRVYGGNYLSPVGASLGAVDTTQVHRATLTSTGSSALFFADSANRTTNASAVYGLDPAIVLGQPFYGDILEVIVYGRSITSAERAALDSYLFNKWINNATATAIIGAATTERRVSSVPRGSSAAAAFLRGVASSASVALTQVILTPRAGIVSPAVASVVVSCSSLGGLHLGLARAAVVLGVNCIWGHNPGAASIVASVYAKAAAAGKARFIMAAGCRGVTGPEPFRCTQLVLEVARAGDSTSQLRCTQLVLEVVGSFTSAGLFKLGQSRANLVMASRATNFWAFSKAAHATVVVAAISASSDNYFADATLTVVMTTNAFVVVPLVRDASALAYLSPTSRSFINSIMGFGSASVTLGVTCNWTYGASAKLALHAGASFAGPRRSQADARIIARARSKYAGVAPPDPSCYIGRFQQGAEVPLLSFPESLTFPLSATAVIYSLGSGHAVEAVDLVRLPSARVNGLFTLGFKLGSLYQPGRYGILYRVPTTKTIGVSLSIFEVMDGGDLAGSLIASFVSQQPSGDQVLAQTDSGQLLYASRPAIP